jgi:hypothetical protein
MKKETKKPLPFEQLPEEWLTSNEYIQCNRCQRKSYGGDNFNGMCNLLQPDGSNCRGLMKLPLK